MVSYSYPIIALIVFLTFASCNCVGAYRYPTGQPEVNESKGEITVLFPQRVGVTLATDRGYVKGIKRATIGEDVVLDSADDDAIEFPRVCTFSGNIEVLDNWSAYLKERQANGGKWPPRGNCRIEEVLLKCRYDAWRQTANGVVVTCKNDAGNVTVEWLLEPTTMTLGDKLYKGLRWKLRVVGMPKTLAVSVEETVAFGAGDWAFSQRWYPFAEGRLGCGEEFKLPQLTYFARQQPFFFKAGKAGSVVSFFGSVVTASVSVAEEPQSVRVCSKIPVKADDEGVIETPTKYWLRADGDCSDKWKALDEWTDVLDGLGDYYRAMSGIRRVEPLPTLMWQSGLEVFDKYQNTGNVSSLEDSWFYRFAEESLPRLAEVGVRTIYLGSVFESDGDHKQEEYAAGAESLGSTCAPWVLEVSPVKGSRSALAYLCNKAHELGMKIVCWSTPAHLSNSSPLLRQHPDWLAWRADGTPETCGYQDITGINLTRGHLDYTVTRYAEMHKATMFDGIWQDSFLTFGALTDFSDGRPYPQLNQTLELQRKLQELGCTELHIEGCGPFGLSSGGFEYWKPEVSAKAVGREYGLYYHIADMVLEPDSYYRALASKGAIGLKSLDEFLNLPDKARQRIMQANRDYLSVMAHMKRRYLIGKGEKWLGVEWRDTDRVRVLFAFERFTYEVADGAIVEDVTAGRTRQVQDSRFTAERWHTYVVTAPLSGKDFSSKPGTTTSDSERMN